MSTFGAAPQQLRLLMNVGQRALLTETAKSLKGCDSVLHVGCGTASVLEQLPRMGHSVGLDAHRPAIEASRARGVHDDYIEATATALPGVDESFDAVIMFDLIEHPEKADGDALLGEAERVARRRVVVFTPNGFVNQGEYNGNPLQEHRSGWSVEDFQARGYAVAGMKGLRALRTEGSTPRSPSTITRPLLSVSQLAVHRRPKRAYALLAVKDVSTAGRTRN